MPRPCLGEPHKIAAAVQRPAGELNLIRFSRPELLVVCPSGPVNPDEGEARLAPASSRSDVSYGVGTSSGSMPSALSSCQRDVGIVVSAMRRFSVTSARERQPTSTAATAG